MHRLLTALWSPEVRKEESLKGCGQLIFNAAASAQPEGAQEPRSFTEKIKALPRFLLEKKPDTVRNAFL